MTFLKLPTEWPHAPSASQWRLTRLKYVYVPSKAGREREREKGRVSSFVTTSQPPGGQYTIINSFINLNFLVYNVKS